MLTYSDVSADPTAFERSNLRESQLAEARALGFDSLAWVAAIPKPLSADAPPPKALLLTAVMFHHAAPMTLSLCHTADIGDDYCLKTLFTDGFIITTESEPTRNRFRSKLSVTSATRHGIDFVFHRMTSLAALVARHEERVRARVAQGGRPVASHDLRAHFAMRKRWREIADPRMRLKMKIAGAFAIAALVAVAVVPFVASHALIAFFGETIARVLQTAAVFGCGPFAFAVFRFALYYVAPLFARAAHAPPMRPADELLKLADDVPTALLPPRDESETTPDAAPPVTTVDLRSTDLARLQRLDLALSMQLALLYPIAVLTSIAVLGNAGAWVVLIAIFTIDSVVNVVANKSTATVLRERIVPELVRAEASAQAAACTGGACWMRTRWAAWLRLGLAVLGVLAIPRILALPHEPRSMSAAAQWAFAGVVLGWTTLSRTRKRHKQLVPAS